MPAPPCRTAEPAPPSRTAEPDRGAVGVLGSLQLILDKGQEADWFSAEWICWAAAISGLSLVCFIVRERTVRDPIVHLDVLRNRNFSLGTLLTALYGFVLYGITSMMPLFLQTLMGYPALDSGLAVSPRGLGCMLSMFVVGPLVNYVDGRLLLAFGFSIVGSSVLMLSHVNLQIASSSVACSHKAMTSRAQQSMMSLMRRPSRTC